LKSLDETVPRTALDSGNLLFTKGRTDSKYRRKLAEKQKQTALRASARSSTFQKAFRPNQVSPQIRRRGHIKLTPSQA
jgi:hypothetical protein